MTHEQSYALPIPLTGTPVLHQHFCKTFLHQLQSLRGGDDPARIYRAIEKTARLSGHTPEAVAQALVENGLRAGRESFPDAFVSRVEKALAMPAWNPGGATENQRALLRLWRQPPAGVLPGREKGRQPPRHGRA